MTNKKTTRRALFSSIMALLLCCSMLLGTTFAWFTDSVTSENNIIKSGTLEVGMYWANTLADIQSETTRKNAAEGAIFNYEYWEPGYVDVKYIQLVNEGDLAFKYQLLLQPENAISDGMKLAEVIDVYCAIVDDASTKNFDFEAPDRADFGSLVKLGTLKDLMLQPEGMDTGVLLPKEGNTRHIDKDTITDEYYEESVTVCLALKMQEEAGNEYQNLSIGDGFAVKLLATQYTYEEDSFDHLYDEWADGGSLVAKVTDLGAQTVNATWGVGGQAFELALSPSFQFEPTETLEEAEKSPYRYYHADFVVSADKDVAAEALALAGYYTAFCKDFNNNNWVALKSDMAIPAGEEIRLVHAMGNGSITVNYEELCRYGNDGVGFRCGASALDPSVIGTTLTVELRLYETTADPSTPDGPKNIETGEYMTIATYKHTFGIDGAKQLQDALAAGGEVTLTQDLDLTIENASVLSSITRETVIDLGGNTLNVEIPEDANIGNQALFQVKKGGDLTIKNGTVEVTYGANANHLTAIISNEGGNVVIDGGEFKITKSGENGALIAAIVDNNTTTGPATVTFNGGTFYSDSGIVRNFVNGHDATIKINGGNFQHGYIWNQDAGSAPGEGFITITGGTFDADDVSIYSKAFPSNVTIDPSVSINTSGIDNF